MKKTILMICGIVFLMASCNEDNDVDIQYQVTIRIDAMDVVKNLREDADGTELFPNGEIIVSGANPLHPRIKCLIYDSDGSLFTEETRIVDDFTKTVSITTKLPGGNYTIVASADLVQHTGDQVNFEFWKFENTSSLEDFKITDLKFDAGLYKVLGIYKNAININEGINSEIRIKPAGSLITFRFWTEFSNEISKIAYSWNKHPDYYHVNDNKATYLDLEKPYKEEFEIDPKYQAFVGVQYFLSTQDLNIHWWTTLSDETVNEGNVVFNTLTPGINYLVSINVISSDLQITEL
ncbi:MAG: FimB/Mfa2 family fimbrial subunit [Tannerella sp.]|jgi:hypothetical protein|nr:FimB/Mfa2 family fimbrial subunit [Tannerella sp.]